MIKKLFVKRILKSTLFPLLNIINSFIPKNDKLVLLYIAHSGIRHTLVPIRKYLLDNNFDRKYRIVCGIESLKYKDDIDRVEFVDSYKSVLVFLRARHVFYTAGQIPIKPSRNQIVIHFSHGSANFKTMGNLTNIDYGDEHFFTYMTATSQLYVPIIMKEYQCPRECVKVIGDPQNDQILSFKKGIYDFSKYNKMILWLPTFRHSTLLSQIDSSQDSPIPLFKEKEFQSLNDYLAKYNIKLIVKLHMAQDCDEIKLVNFSHLNIYSHEEFIQNGYELYQLMAESDVLVGDYSSASLQYLLTDRPQGYVVPDIEDYKLGRGIVFEEPEDYMGGHIIKTQKQFYDFIDDIAANKDVYKEKRHWVTKQIFEYQDCRNCERAIALSEMSM